MPDYCDTRSASVDSASAWIAWSGTDSSTIWSVWIQGTAGAYTPPSEAELAQQKAERERRDEERKKADERAEALLLAHLTPDQRETLERMRHFVVQSERGRVYRLRRGRLANVDEMDKDRVVAQYCIHPSIHNIPEADSLLAQKLMLEMNEEQFLRIANRTAVAA